MFSQCAFSDSGFQNSVIKDESELVIIRSNVKNEDDVEKWKNVYCRAFCTTFNSLQRYSVQRCLLHRRYICIFGDKRHKGKRKTYTGCGFTINFKIKLNTKATRKRDKLVQELPCIITMKGKHNHKTNSAAALNQMRLLPDVKEEFMRYFDLGMTPSQAIKFHQEKLGLDSTHMANSAINPSAKAVYYTHEVWLRKNHGAIGGNKVNENSKENVAAKIVPVRYKEEEPQHDDSYDDEFVDVKSEPIEFEEEEQHYDDLMRLSDEKQKLEVFKEEDTVFVKEDMNETAELSQSQELQVDSLENENSVSNEQFLTSSSYKANIPPAVENSQRKSNEDKTDAILSLVEERMKSWCPGDEFDTIGKNFGAKLRSVAKDQRLYAEKLINDVLSEAELGNLNRHWTLKSSLN